ncbi:Pinin-like protein, partial [Euroglyphus maynei]
MNLFEKLESSYETIQKSLLIIDDDIKRITGKDPGREFDDKNNGGRRFYGRQSFAGNKRKLIDHDEYDDYDDENQPNNNKRSLQSQVVATSWEMKHRNQVLEEQKNDKKSMSRNRRMFGHILGTLEKFKNEQSQRKDLQKRAEIEQKLDQVDEQEREALKNEREKLFKERKSKRLQMKCLEMKLQRAEIHKQWEQSQQYLGNFIETKTKPNIFYMPVKHTTETMKRSQETKDKYRIIFAEKRAKIQKELNEIDEMFRIDDAD